MRRRSRARWALRFLTTPRSGLASMVFAAVFSSMMMAGPPSVAIFVAAMLPSGVSLSVAGAAAVAGSGVSAIAATFTSSLATGVAASAGVTGVAAVVSSAGISGLS